MRPLAAVQRWLFRLGRDEQVPIVLTQRRIFIVPTRGGVVFAIVLAVMLIGAINYNLSLGHEMCIRDRLKAYCTGSRAS